MLKGTNVSEIMTEINPSDSNQTNPTPGNPLKGEPTKFDLSGVGSGTYQSGGQGWESYEKWLGPEGFKQFQKNLMQSIVTQIGKDKQKEHETALKLQAAEKGEDPNDV